MLLILFLTGLLAGTIDAIAGGGGLITIPVLLSMGLSPPLAFGTNKLQGMVGTLNAVLNFYRRGLICFRGVFLGIGCCLIGAVGGAITNQWMSNEILRKIIPILLGLVLVYSLITPRLGHLDLKPKMRESWFYALFGLILGFYDGFFGPGTGSFWAISLTFFLGYNLVKATGYTKLFNLTSSVIAFFCFAIGGNVDYRIGLCMAAGQLIGGYLGATLAITKGAALIRPVFLVMVTLTIASLVYRNYLSSSTVMNIVEHWRIIPLVLLCALPIVLIGSNRIRKR